MSSAPLVTRTALNSSLVFLAVALGCTSASWCEDRARGEKLRDVRAALLARTEISVERQPLRDVLKQLAEQHGIAIRLDETALKSAGIPPGAPVTASVKDHTLLAVLRLILKEYGLKFVAENDAILVTVDRPEKTPSVTQPAPVEPPADIVERFQRRLRPSLRAEIEHIRQLCRPAPEQMAGIEKNSLAILAEVAQECARQAVLDTSDAGGRAVAPLGTRGDPRMKIRERLILVVSSHLTSKQMEILQEATIARITERRRAIVGEFVARIDEYLFLTETQQSQFGELLTAQWREGWPSLVDAALLNREFVPNLPDELVAPVLSALQLEIWKVIAKSDGGGSVMNSRLLFLGEELDDPQADVPDSASVAVPAGGKQAP